MSRVLWAAVVAAALAVVLATRVFVSFDAVRVKLVKAPITVVHGTVRIETDHDIRAAALEAPVAVIAVINNPGHSGETFSIAADGQAVCTVTVAASSSTRTDCVINGDWIRGPSHVLEIHSAAPMWSLDFLEIATHHGSSSRLLTFHVLPDVTASHEGPGRTSVVLAWIVLWGLFLVRPSAWPPLAVWSHRVAAGALVALSAAMVVSPWVSPYRLVMPLTAFAEVCVVLSAPRLWRLGTLAVNGLSHVPWGAWLWRPGVAVSLVAVIVGAVFAVFVRANVHEFNGNYTGLLRISEEGFDRSPLFTGRGDIRDTLVLVPNEGYDGQFMYFAAFDPLLQRFREEPQRYRDVVDAPPYRFGRIGLPWMVRAVAGDRWHWYPAVMIGLLVIGGAVAAGAVARLAQLNGKSALWGLVVLAIPGFWQSMRMVLPEPVAAATLLLGYLCVVQRRVVWGAVLFAASLLVRETGVAFVAALVVLMPESLLAWRHRVVIAAAVVPLVLWHLYLAAGLWTDWGWEALFFPGGNLSVPFVGISQLWSTVAAGTYHPSVAALSTAAVWFPLLLVLVTGVGIGLRSRTDRHLMVPFAAYALMALSLTFPKVWGHVANVQRTSYELFVLFALLTVTLHADNPRRRWVVVACWVACAAFVLYGAHDASNTRAALFPW